MIHSEEQATKFKEYMDGFIDCGQSDFDVYNDFVRTTKTEKHDFQTFVWYLNQITRIRGGRA